VNDTIISPGARASGGIIRRGVSAISGAFGALSAVGVIVLMLVTVTDVAFRNLLNEGIPGAVEAGSVLLVCVVFLGLPIAHQRKAHVSTSLLTDHLPRSLGLLARSVANAVMTLVSGCLALATLGAGVRSFEVREFVQGLISVPVWPAKLAIPIGLSLLACVSLIATVETASGLVALRRAWAKHQSDEPA
jgi:TRAP-type C4-dicarboxylate transport system permease small subunit